MGTNSSLKVGDLVMLSPNTRWITYVNPWNPLNTIGEVVSIQSEFYENDSIYVRWASFTDLHHLSVGTLYQGGDSDLILQTPITKFKTREEARKARKGTDLVVVDLGLEEKYRWHTTVKEV